MFVVSPNATEIEVSISCHLSDFFIFSTLRDSKHVREFHLAWCCSSTIEKEKMKTQQCIPLLFNFHCIFDTIVVNYSATTSLTKLRFFILPWETRLYGMFFVLWTKKMLYIVSQVNPAGRHVMYFASILGSFIWS